MTFNKIVWPVLMLALCGSAAYAQNNVGPVAKKIESALQQQLVKQMAPINKCHNLSETIRIGINPSMFCKSIEQFKKFCEACKKQTADICKDLLTKQTADTCKDLLTKIEPNYEVCECCGKEIKHPYQHCEAENSKGLCQAAQKDSTAKKTYKIPHAPVVGEKCTICGEEVKHPYQHCRAKHGTGLCETAEKDTTSNKKLEKFCTECDRTEAQVKLHGHNHKPPYIFQ